MKERIQNEVKLMTQIGIIQQLLATRQAKHFAKLELSYSQFTILKHFSNNPEKEWTITSLADVMEMNQPGITKVVSKLIDKNLLSAKSDSQDARKKHLKITPQGLSLCDKIIRSLIPDISNMLSSWDDNQLIDMQIHIEKLMRWLDENRDNITK